MKNLYVLRHGLTEYNKGKKFQGRANPPLIEEGLQQAQNLAGVFEDVPFESIYCSPLERAVQTATPLAESKNLKIRFNEKLIDRDLGGLTGKSYEDIDDVELYLLNRGLEQEVKGLESVEDVHKRAQEFLEQIIETEEENSVVVTHSPIIQSFCKIVFGNEPRQYNAQYVLIPGEFHYFELNKDRTLIRFKLKATEAPE